MLFAYITLVTANDVCNLSTLTKLDTIAMSSIMGQKFEPAIYLCKNLMIEQITPINYSRMTVRPVIALQTRMQFQGATSRNILYNDTLYLYIADTIQNVYKIDNFKLISLKSDGEYRHIITASDIYYFPLPGTRTKDIDITFLTNGIYRIVLPKSIKSGEYGIFYDFGGKLPVKLYDFKIL